jgi:hypothetical protein
MTFPEMTRWSRQRLWPAQSCHFLCFTRAVIAASSKKMQAQAFEKLLVAREP